MSSSSSSSSSDGLLSRSSTSSSPSLSLSSSSSESSGSSDNLPTPETNLVISLMRETFPGIEVPGPEAYTLRPGTPLTPEQVGRIWELLNARGREGGLNDIDVPNQAQQIAQPAGDFNNLHCLQCHKEFKTKATYRQHSQDVHIGTICLWPGCWMIFPSERELNTHLKLHNSLAAEDDPRGMLTCNFPGCGKVCTMAESVARHLRRHIIEAQNPSQS